MKPTELVTDQEIREHLDRACTHVKAIAASGQREIYPLLHIMSRSKPGEPFSPIIIKVDQLPEAPDDRMAIFARIGHHAASVVTPDALPCLAIHMTEAWMVLAALGEDITCRPSKSPKRVECVVISAMAIDGRSAGAIYELRRRSDQTLVLVERNAVPRTVAPADGETALRSNLLAALFDGVHAVR